MNKKVTIIGAGLVGSLWALLLRKQNYDVTIFEKRGDIRKNTNDGGRSINLILTSRGLNALDVAGLKEKALALAVPVYGRMMHAKTGETVFQPYGQDNEKNYSISRSALNTFLLDAAEKAGAKINFNCPLDNIDFTKQTLHFSQESSVSTHSYDLLFGTDGAGSVVRKSMLQKFPQNYQEKTQWLEADYKELFLPLSSSGEPQLDFKSLHIWPRGSHMMMALANLDGSFTMTIYLPKQGPVSFSSVKTTEQIENLFQSEFPDAIPLMPTYKKDFLEHPQGALGTVRFSSWIYQDSVALMGDAAHAIVPFFGQGMNSGFEDCTELLKIMQQTPNQWDKILYSYDQIQRPNANAIADMALENWIEMSVKVGDPKFLLRKKVESTLEKNFPHLFKSRYGMVTYTLIPYALVQKAGFKQDELLGYLCSQLQTIEDLSLSQAEQILKTQYVPFLQNHNIRLEKYSM